MPWKPTVEGEVPTLGWLVIDWMTEMLAAPARMDYEPFVPMLEQEDFILRWYEINPTTGRFRYSRGLLGRPRGWGKSPILGALALCEALGDVLFDGWDADGQPVARPWSTVRTPLVHIAAVSEEQTKNTWQPLVEMLHEEAPIHDEYPGIEPFDSAIILPHGAINKITKSPATVKGAPSVFGVLDQTEEWVPSTGGPKLAQYIRTNCDKNGGRTLESPNAFIPGTQSVAEMSFDYAQAIAEGRVRFDGLLYDVREAPADTDLTDRESLLTGLRYVYGCASDHPDGCVLHDPPCKPGWAPVESHVDKFWDPSYDVRILRADFLNQQTHASDSWVTRPDWRAAHCDLIDGFDPVQPGDVVTLGFDGSAGRKKGKADATALIGCRVSDGHLFTIRVWEQPDGPAGKDWAAPVDEVDAEIKTAFDTYHVAGFLADPSGWATNVATWEAKYGRRLKVKATAQAPIAAWPRAKDSRVVEYVKRLHDAIIGRECSHDGTGPLTRHVLNARRRHTKQGYLLYKAYPDSPNKIDAAYAATLAWKARTDAVAKGVSTRRRPVEKSSSKRRVVVMSD